MTDEICIFLIMMRQIIEDLKQVYCLRENCALWTKELRCCSFKAIAFKLGEKQ